MCIFGGALDGKANSIHKGSNRDRSLGVGGTPLMRGGGRWVLTECERM